MAASQLCQRCAKGQRPESYVVSLAGSCCQCGVGEKEKSRCGACGNGGSHCAQCDEFNGYFELKRTDSDCCLYEYEFSPDAPCGATKIQMRLRPHQDEDKVNVCVGIIFDQSQGAVRPVSWGKTNVGDCCQIGVLRRRTTNSKCCWPHQITVTPVPVPDYVVPEPEWAISDPDDLNDAPYWPKMDVDLMEDSDGVPVRYFNGELQLRRKDLGSDGFGIPWGHTRIYSNRLSNSFDFGNGFNWLVHEWPRLVRLKSNPKELEKISPWMLPPKPHEPTGCTIVVLRGTRNALWFDQYKDPQDPAKFKWLPRFGAKHTLTHDDTKDMIFTLATPNGQFWDFYDFTPASGQSLQNLSKAERDKRSPGCLKLHFSSGGQEFHFEYKGCKLQSATREYRQNSAPNEYAHETFEYKYYDDAGASPCKCQQDDPNKGRLCTVLLKRKDANGTKSDVRRVHFVYYAGKQTEKDHGNVGDLKLAVVQAPGQNAWRNLAVDYCRYHTKTYDTYCQGMLKYFVGPEAFRRIVRQAKSLNPPAPDAEIAPELLWIADHSVDHLSNLMDTVMESTVQQFADLHVEYHEADRRVKEITIAGGDHKRTFAYQKDEQADANEKSEFNKGKWITTETRPAYGGEVTVHSNLAGQTTWFKLKDEKGRIFHRRMIYDIHPATLQNGASIPSLLEVLEPSKLDGQGQEKSLGLAHAFHYQEVYPGCRYLNSVTVSVPGGAEELRKYSYEKQGVQGCQIAALNFVTYRKVTVEDPPPPSSSSAPVPPSSQDSVTEYVNNFSDPNVAGAVTNHMRSRVTKLMQVPQSQNGNPPSATPSIQENFDDHGNLRQMRDLRGTWTTSEFHASTGAPKFVNVQFARPLQNDIRTIQTSFKSDQLGRITQILGPQHDAVVDPNTSAVAAARTATWYVYKDISGQVWTAHGHVAGQVEVQINPVQIDRIDRAGRVTDSVLAVRTQQGRPTPQETMIPQQSWGGWTAQGYDDKSRLVESRVYHHIPTSGAGSAGTNYDASKVEYDEMRLPKRTISPGGTISEVEYTSRGLVKSVKTGVATTSLAIENFYDGEESDPTATGNGLLTMQVRHLGGGAVHMAGFGYDSRDRQVYSRFSNGVLMGTGQPLPQGPVSVYGKRYTNQDHVFEESQGTPAVPAGLQTVNLIDVRGRVYRTLHTGTAVQAGPSGTVLTRLVDNIWYNDAGDVLRYQPHGSDVFVRSEYDGLGREARRFVATDSFTAAKAKADSDARVPNSVNPSNASQTEIAHEIVTNSWDDASNLLVVVNQYPGAQPTWGNPTYRSEGVGFRYDSLGRLLFTADIGAQSPVPITAQTRFDNLGNPYLLLDPLGRKTIRAFDHAQRVVSVTENLGGGAPGGRMTEFEYSPDGPMTKIVYRPPGKNAQVTEYEFNSPLFSHMPSAIRYPGAASTTDAERFEYNLLGEVTNYTDRNGTAHRFTYDQLRRIISDKIAAFGSSVDQTVGEIAYEYDGTNEQLSTVISRGVTNGGMQDKNMVLRIFNGRQQVETEVQWHDNPGPARYPYSLKVGYEYADGSANHVQLTNISYPAEYVKLAISYDNLARPTALAFGSFAPWINYSYWGADRIYEVSLPDLGTPLSSALEYFSPEFSQVDAFDRRTSLIWSKENLLGTTIENVGYKYLLQGIRRYRDDIQAGTKDRSQLYSYDSLDRLTGMQRGRLITTAAGQPTVPVVNLAQSWGLDGADNWDSHSQWANPPTRRWQTQFQQRTHDDSNRLTHVRRTGNEVKQVRIDGTAPTSGNFTLTIQNQTTANIAHNASAATVQARLEALSPIGSGNVKCTGGPLPDQPVHVEFVGSRANKDMAPLFAANVNLNAGTPTVGIYMEGGLKQIPAQHDKNGNTTRVPDVFLDQKVECTYDAWNRLVAVKKDGAEVARYGYDGLHRRITKSLPSGKTRHYYHSLAEQVLEERVVPDDAGQADVKRAITDRRYAWGVRGLDDLAIRERYLETVGNVLHYERHHPIQDDNFNVTALVNANSGDLEERFTYDPYGQFEIYDADYRARIASQYDWDILYAGYRFDFESGLYHVRRRQYSPYLGRWLQQDPLGYVDSYNLYQYCHSSPVNYIDPTGEIAPLIAALAVIALASIAFGLAETGVEYLITPEDEWAEAGGFWPTLGKNVGFNLLTAGIGGKFKLGGRVGVMLAGRWLGKRAAYRLGAYGSTWVLRQGTEIGLDTAWDVGIHRRSVGSALLYNTVGSIGGELGARAFGAALSRSIRQGGFLSRYTGDWRGWSEGFADTGAYSWGNVSARLRSAGWAARRQVIHHRLIAQGGTRGGAGRLTMRGFFREQYGRYIPNIIKNMRWNLRRVGMGDFTPDVHNALHGRNPAMRLNILQRIWQGSNIYDKIAAGAIAAGGAYAVSEALDQ
jgi:RHS repeat-associated protein